MLAAYKTIRAELKQYSQELEDKTEYILLTKTDMVTEEEVEKKKKALSKLKREILTVSVIDDNALKNLSDFLVKMLRNS